MGKKVDLNKPRNSGANLKRNNYHPNFLNYNNNSNSSSSDTENQPKEPNAIQKKAGETALRAAGVPKEAAKTLSNDSRIYKASGTLMMPKTVKIVMTASIIFVPFMLLMIFVVIFGNEESSSSYGSFAYGQTCPTITVVNTGCSGNADNCTNIYDGDVELEDYVAGVVAAEVGMVNNLEYYKVMAIAARTFVLRKAGSDCTVEGNTTFQSYEDVDDHKNAAIIRQAVEETEGLILVKNGDLAKTNYASACVVNADDEYYYVRYGTSSLGEANFQKIPKSWDIEESGFRGYLGKWYAKVDQTDTDYVNKKCPNNHDYGMTQIGALYLITGENYSYKDVISYYYGEEAEIMKNEMQLSGNNGFINPTRKINCTSAFGYRIHPVKGIKKFHTGLDIGIAGGEPIYAANNGTVTRVVNNVNAINNCAYGYGNYIIIDHGEGISSVYAHIKYGTIPSSIYVGATVTQGTQIGQVGSTGCSTGNHLHYEVRNNNKQVDPADYLDLTEAKGTCKK